MNCARWELIEKVAHDDAISEFMDWLLFLLYNNYGYLLQQYVERELFFQIPIHIILMWFSTLVALFPNAIIFNFLFQWNHLQPSGCFWDYFYFEYDGSGRSWIASTYWV